MSFDPDKQTCEPEASAEAVAAEAPADAASAAAKAAGAPADDDVRRVLILLHTGAPAAPTPEAVEELLREFLMHPHIRRCPKFVWRRVLERKILPRRKHKIAERYGRFWVHPPRAKAEAGCSPQQLHARELADTLERAFLATGRDVEVVPAAVFGTVDRLDDVLARIYAAPSATADPRVGFVTLFPQDAWSSSEGLAHSAREALARVAGDEAARRAPVLTEYASRPEFMGGVASSVADAGFDPSRDHLLMTFHSIPLEDVKRRHDTYGDQVHATCQGIARRLSLPDAARVPRAPEEFAGNWSMGFMSVFRNAKRWMGPFSHDAAEQLGRTCTREGRVFVVCPGFSLDCLETLYDVDFELAPCFVQGRADAGTTAETYAKTASKFVRVNCLNASPLHARAIVGAFDERFAGFF